MRRFITLTSVAAVAALATACGGGGGSSAPSDASKADFCKSYVSVLDYTNPMEQEQPTGKDIKEYASNLEETGTPEDMSDEEREGFEVFIEATDKLEDDTKMEDADDIAKVSEEDKGKVDKFDAYAQDNCKAEMQAKIKEMMPEMPSGMPTPTP